MWSIALLSLLLQPSPACPGHGKLQKCYTGPSQTRGVGRCRDGIQSCIAQRWGPCLCGQLPAKERCDCSDNDCNGIVDESCTCGCVGVKRACGYSNSGVCKRGTQTCIGFGRWGLCHDTIGPSKEQCDGKDNDCDGNIDENLSCGPCKDGETRSCFPYGEALLKEGECKAGTQTCAAGKWGPCTGAVLPKAELCNNKDDDCNGYVDGMHRVCGTDTGDCQRGIQDCELGTWGSCREAIEPKPEVCDCRDNDCDGKTDEDVSCSRPGTICYHGRCVPNCAKGTCIRPGEALPEPPRPEPRPEPQPEPPMEPRPEPSQEARAPEPPPEPGPSIEKASEPSPEPRTSPDAGAQNPRERITGEIDIKLKACGCNTGRPSPGSLGVLLMLWVALAARKRL